MLTSAYHVQLDVKLETEIDTQSDESQRAPTPDFQV